MHKDNLNNKTGFDFWQDHSVKFLEMAFRTDKRERIERPDGYGKNTGKCGDTVEMFVIVENERIQTISFNTNGCVHTNACANTVAFLAEGKTIDQAWNVTPDAVADYLETLPLDHTHCADVAVGALYLALSDFQKIRKNLWKKIYRK